MVDKNKKKSGINKVPSLLEAGSRTVHCPGQINGRIFMASASSSHAIILGGCLCVGEGSEGEGVLLSIMLLHLVKILGDCVHSRSNSGDCGRREILLLIVR